MYVAPTLQPGQFAIYAINTVKVDLPKKDNADEYEKKITRQYIPITFFNGVVSSQFSTYDESLQIKDNSQYSFSFSIAKYCNNELNPFFYLIIEGRRLRLQTYERKIDFVVTSITPQITSKNTIYQVTCQDAFSYDFSKQNILISYSNKESGPQDIKSLAIDILSTAKMNTKWRIDDDLEGGAYADFPSTEYLVNDVKDTRLRMKVTMEVSSSTPYNAMTQICQLFNALLRVDYPDKEDDLGVIYFINKNSIQFKGYNLRPEVNLTNLSISRKADSFCSLLHVSGGEDADGILTSLVPSIPSDVQAFLRMMYPLKCTEKEWYAARKSMSQPWVIVYYTDKPELGYQKWWCAGPGQYIETKQTTPYIPWLEKSAEEIKKEFVDLKTHDGLTIFKTNTDDEINDFFNFLAINCKAASSILYSFDYFLDNGLMNQDLYDDLNRLFDRRLRNANLLLYALNTLYFTMQNNLNVFEDKEEEFIAQLAALNEEEFGYLTGELKTEADELLKVSASGTIERSSIYAMINEERTNVLNSLSTDVFGNKDYSELLMNFYGNTAVDDKIKKLRDSLNEANARYEEYTSKMQRILDVNAKKGTIYLTKAETKTSLLDYASLGLSQQGTLVVQTFDNKTTYKIGGYQLEFENAVLSPTPSDKHDTPDDTTDKYSIDTDKHSITLTIYTKTDDKNYTITTQTYTEAITLDQREEFLSQNSRDFYVEFCTYKQKANKLLSKIDSDPTLITEDISKLTLRNSNNSNAYLNTINKTNKTVVRKGFYSTYIELLNSFNGEQGYTTTGQWVDTKTYYNNPLNVVSQKAEQEKEVQETWSEIYAKYGDFIVESSFSDTNQLSSGALYTSAMNAFSQYCKPTFEYNTTIINQNALMYVESDEVKVGDIVHLYNYEYNSKYNGYLKLKIFKNSILMDKEIKANMGLLHPPVTLYYDDNNITNSVVRTKFNIANRYKIIPGEEYELYADGRWCEEHGHVHCGEHGCPDESDLPIGEHLILVESNHLLTQEEFDNMNLTPIVEDYYQIGERHYIKANSTALIKQYVIDNITKIEVDGDYVILYCPMEQNLALEMISKLAQLNVLEANQRYYKIAGLELDRIAAPIPLQITGITTKLREQTSQLTVSNNRVMQGILYRLLKNAK